MCTCAAPGFSSVYPHLERSVLRQEAEHAAAAWAPVRPEDLTISFLHNGSFTEDAYVCRYVRTYWVEVWERFLKRRNNSNNNKHYMRQSSIIDIKTGTRGGFTHNRQGTQRWWSSARSANPVRSRQPRAFVPDHQSKREASRHSGPRVTYFWPL